MAEPFWGYLGFAGGHIIGYRGYWGFAGGRIIGYRRLF